jgi:CubicO group peptidase (beta-lactamase class C family)
MFKLFADKPLLFVPGSRWQYNQANYMLLGRIIEKLSGQSYPEFIKTQLFAPVGVPTTFGYSQIPIPNKAHAYTVLHWTPTGVSRLKQVQLETSVGPLPSMLWPAGGLNLNVLDFSKWLIALQSGKVIRRESLERLWVPTKLNDGGTYEQGPDSPWHNIGLGWGSTSADGRRWVGFSGGTTTTFSMYPAEDLDVIVLTNLGGSNPESMAKAIAEMYLARSGAQAQVAGGAR